MVPTNTDDSALWKNPSQLPYHTRQFDNPYRSTLHFAEFIRSCSPVGESAVDVCCGAGANIFQLSTRIPGYRWTGVDIAGELLFPIGRPYFQSASLDVDLVEGDCFHLTDIFPERRFDLVLPIQTLSWLPRWEEALRQLFAVSRGWLFISSLFTDFDVDITYTAVDYSEPITLQVPYHIHVFGLQRFRAYCEKRGCQEFVTQDFDIDIDLPQKSEGLGTFTHILASGKRIQFSGPMYFPWKFVGVKMPGGKANYPL